MLYGLGTFSAPEAHISILEAFLKSNTNPANMQSRASCYRDSRQENPACGSRQVCLLGINLPLLFEIV